MYSEIYYTLTHNAPRKVVSNQWPVTRLYRSSCIELVGKKMTWAESQVDSRGEKGK